MTGSHLYNAYCDESCNHAHDGIPIMALGAVTWLEQEVRDAEVSMRVSASKGVKR